MPWTRPVATRKGLAYGVVHIHTVGVTNVMQKGVRAMRSLVTGCIVLLSVVVGCASPPPSPVRSAACLVPVPVPETEPLRHITESYSTAEAIAASAFWTILGLAALLTEQHEREHAAAAHVVASQRKAFQEV